MKPEAAVDRLTRAIVLADMIGARVVNTDEMLKPDWMDDVEAHQAMHYTLQRLSHVAARHEIFICIEPHGIYTKTAEGLLQHREPRSLAVDRGQLGHRKFLPRRPRRSLRGPDARPRSRASRPCQGHHIGHAAAERGKVTGTPVGCACGDGVVDWERVLSILDPLDREITLSVECGTIDQAARSLAFLRKLLGGAHAR